MSDHTAHRSSYQGRAVCVTGGAGFIGSHLVDALVECGARVTVLDDFSNGREDNLAGAGRQARVVRGSVCDPGAIDRAVAGCEVVFHQAALGSVPRSIEMPQKYQEVNALGTLQVLEASRRHGVHRVVYAASSSAYGQAQSLPKVECMRPEPVSPYACTKLAGEHMLRTWCACYGLQGVSLRYFNIFGPRQRHDSPYAAVVPLFARHLREGTRPTIYGDGATTRDFTFVANAVEANLLAGAVARPLTGETVNVACGVRYSLLQLLETMAGLLGARVEPRFEPERAGDVKDSQADIRAAEALLGYRVLVPFEEGLRRTLVSLGE